MYYYKVGTKHFCLLSIIATALAATSCPASLLVMTLNFCVRDLSSNPTRFVVVIVLPVKCFFFFCFFFCFFFFFFFFFLCLLFCFSYNTSHCIVCVLEPGRIGTLVSMATNSSHILIKGKKIKQHKNIFFSKTSRPRAFIFSV